MEEISLELISMLLSNHIKQGGTQAHEDVRPGSSGFVPGAEGASMIHGVVGAKGSLLNQEIDLNTITHGGIYVFSTPNATNSPFLKEQVAGNSTLIVLRNFSDNPDASDSEAMIFQIVISHNQTPDIAIRYSSSGNFRTWKYLTSYILWNIGGNGQGVVDTTFSLTKSINDFDRLEIEYISIGSNSRQNISFAINSNTTRFDIREFNLPNDQASLANVQMGEIRLTPDSTGTVLTAVRTTLAIAKAGGLVDDASIQNSMRITRIKGVNKI